MVHGTALILGTPVAFSANNFLLNCIRLRIQMTSYSVQNSAHLCLSPFYLLFFHYLVLCSIPVYCIFDQFDEQVDCEKASPRVLSITFPSPHWKEKLPLY
eukprot:NODE_970_length_2685_cov_0.314772.p5 type:complete len:100 gc:universal NODE_970_length_2685_cov_0.314772:1882-2181(+)